MNMQLSRWIAVIAVSFAVAACSGGDEGASFGSGGSGTGGGTTDPGSTAATPVPSIGVVNGTTFTAGALEIGTSPLSAGGTSSVRVDIVDTANANAPITDSVTVTFTSTCISQGFATMPPVTTTTGSASGTYTDFGCGATDTITARAVIGNALLATGNIVVQSDTLGSIIFVSATPTSIGLRGTGNEISRVKFRVESGSGGPVRNQSVSFTLDTTAGGITFSNGMTTTTASTDNNGEVVVIVKSGTVTTPVRVRATATVMTTSIASQSEQLRIETSIADQDSFTIAAEVGNPLGNGCVGTEDEITVRLADRFNNPVKDGTAVSFTAEGGAIEPSCTTVNGACSVTWVSQNPIPFNYCGATNATFTGANSISTGYFNTSATNDDDNDETTSDCGDDDDTDFDNGPRPSRATILATAVGEEAFVDSNANGLFNTGEPFFDLGEAILDKNADGTFDLFDTFVDFNNDGGSPDAASGNFTGLLCEVPADCDPATSLHVRAQLVLAMSAGVPDFDYAPHITTSPDGAYDDADNLFVIGTEETALIGFTLRDFNRQPLPAGSTVAFTITGDSHTVTAGASQTDKGSNDDSFSGNTYVVAITGGDADSGQTAALEMKVTTPGCGSGSSREIYYVFGLSKT